MLVRTYGCALMGVAAIHITVEVNVDVGIGFHLVGLPDSAIKESQQRIDTALNNYNFRMPGRKIVVNMAPADIRKEGSAYDLTLAIAILAASEQIRGAARLEDYYVMGELSLDGTLQEFLPGFLILARHTGAKVIPLAVSGGYQMFKRETVKIGNPIDFDVSQKGRPSVILKKGAEICKDTIKNMME